VTTASDQLRLDRLFERAAPAYDLQLLLERRALRTAARLAGPLGGLRVLDLATGTGALAAAMLERGDPPIELVAVDRSAAMLARARRRLAPFEDRSRVRVALADARRLPYPGGTFNLVASGYFLHLLERENAVAALEEVRRVLRPGGRLVVVVHSAPATRLGGLYRRGWRALARVLPLAGAGPLEDARPLLVSVGFSIRSERRTGLGYWSQVLLAERA
jgi:demethylmenaquinone methyltransferase / 2-methoxy-6-polyprenyl-1,4-benzoquinol methylase